MIRTESISKIGLKTVSSRWQYCQIFLEMKLDALAVFEISLKAGIWAKFVILKNGGLYP